MCGIVGLHLRDPALYPALGSMLGAMIGQVVERGPDSAGVALYGDADGTVDRDAGPSTGEPAGAPSAWSVPGQMTVSLLVAEPPPSDLTARLCALVGAPVTVRTAAGAATVSAATDADALSSAVARVLPAALIVGVGTDFAVLKGVGNPLALTAQLGLDDVQGWQGIAHTRMATESAVSAAGAHPFSVGPGQCLVHNGSFANHATIRRELVADGVRFDTDNDSEVGARFVAAQLAAGADVDKALRLLCERFDGFYTLLVTTSDSFAVVRDAIACKPAIIAETPRWVAMASEYRALAQLPGIAGAHIFEPEPERVYVWQR